MHIECKRNRVKRSIRLSTMRHGTRMQLMYHWNSLISICERVPIYFPKGQSFSLFHSCFLAMFWSYRNEIRFCTQTKTDGDEKLRTIIIFFYCQASKHIFRFDKCVTIELKYLVKFATCKHFYFLNWRNVSVETIYNKEISDIYIYVMSSVG